jgi:AraC-like DNA-binding protein
MWTDAVVASRRTPSASAAPQRSGAHSPSAVKTDHGFIRTLLAGPRRTMADAFRAARESPHVTERLDHPSRGVMLARVTSGFGPAQGYFELLQLHDDVLLVVENLSHVPPRYELALGEGMLTVHMRLTGEFVASIGQADPVRFQGPHLGARFVPAGVENPIYWPAAPRARSVTMLCRPEFVTSQIVGGHAVVPRQLEQLLATVPPEISYCRPSVTAELLGAVSSLIDNPLSGTLRAVYAEAKTLELLSLIVSSFARLGDNSIELYSETDVRRFHKAREILATRFNPAPTISMIARELAMNETKLKSGFKALFGHTVFDYGHECRMQHALHLLRDKRMRISQVAEAVGYQHQGTFASAFKAHFGIRPKDVRRPPAPIAMTAATAK